ncbi:MAG: hypothetical protein ABFS10_03470 [Bacteroidota bacterium]
MAKLKEHIGRKILKHKKRGINRDVRVHNFDTAKTAVILFDTGNTASFEVIHEFRKFMEKKGIKCRAYGYVAQKEIPQEMLFRKRYAFISRSDLNWYMKPSGEAVDSFYGSEPDILVDFTPDMPLELQFLVQLSNASFKVGCFTEADNDYDMMINLTGQNDTGFLAEQFKLYIAMLTPTKNR